MTFVAVITLTDNRCNYEDDEGTLVKLYRSLLAAKDEGLVSDKAYDELRMALPESVRSQIPPLSAILQERKTKKNDIKTIPIVEALKRDMIVV